MAATERTILIGLFLASTLLSADADRARAQDSDRAEGPQADSPQAPIRLNTIGYLPITTKRATVAESGQTFQIVRALDRAVVFEGELSGPTENPDTGERLWAADFSAVVEPGEYRLVLSGVGESPSFRIEDDLYRQPFRTVTRAMYLWRCGTAVHGEYDGDIFEHAACHLEDAFDNFLTEPSPIPSPNEKGNLRRATGGWHDAGDFNKYVGNAGVTVGCMLRAWEDFGTQIEQIELEIPASGGKLPDFLSEVKWELDWLLLMQTDDGSVYNKISAQNYCGYIMPEDELEKRYFAPWSSSATADFVAMTAMAARSLRPYDAEYADRLLSAARKSYQFLATHPDERQSDQSGFTTGGYGSPDWDDRLWAAAELWESTGGADALEDFETRARSPQPERRRGRRNRGDGSRRPMVSQWQAATDWDWGNVHNLGLITYAFSSRPGRSEELVSQIESGLVAAADGIVATARSHGYARPLGERYYWGCNGGVARQVLVLEAANRIAPKPAYREAALDALNYLFGRNVHGRSYVTGLGDRPPMHPHDRRSAADDVVAPWPGNLVGGPERNARNWNDEQDDYRTNEIAINWNGALIYALAAFLDRTNSTSETRETSP